MRIAVEFTVRSPTIQVASNPSRLIIHFPGVALGEQGRSIAIGRNGVDEVQVKSSQATPAGTLVTVGMDSARPYGIEASGNKVILRILPHPDQEVRGAATTSPGVVKSVPGVEQAGEAPAPLREDKTRDEDKPTDWPQAIEMIAALSTSMPDVEHLAPASVVEEAPAEAPCPMRRFRVKFVSGKTAYIDGGSNSGLRMGMNLDIRDPHAGVAKAGESSSDDKTIASVRIVGVATTSAITEMGASNGDLQVGDWAGLTPADAAVASRNVLTSATESYRAPASTIEEDENTAATPGMSSPMVFARRNRRR